MVKGQKVCFQYFTILIFQVWFKDLPVVIFHQKRNMATHIVANGFLPENISL